MLFLYVQICIYNLVVLNVIHREYMETQKMQFGHTNNKISIIFSYRVLKVVDKKNINLSRYILHT